MQVTGKLKNRIAAPLFVIRITFLGSNHVRTKKNYKGLKNTKRKEPPPCTSVQDGGFPHFPISLPYPPARSPRLPYPQHPQSQPGFG